MKKRLAAAAIASLLATTAGVAAASEPGSGLAICSKCTTTSLVSQTGTGTSKAKVVAEVTQRDIDGYCENFVYDQNRQAECKAGGSAPGGILDQRLVSSADCTAGRIVDAYGDGFNAIGIWRADEDGVGYAEDRIKFRGDNGKIELGIGAANGVSLAVNYMMMCPAGLEGVKTLAASKPVSENRPKVVILASVVSLSSLSGNAYDHNGSQMRIDRDKGLIVYEEPKSSISGTVSGGQVLFRGKLPWRSMKASGTAYTFKKGCAPAPYPVTGYWTEDQDLHLFGAAPKRAKDGCAIIGYSKSGGNAKLAFKSLMSP